MKEPDTITTPTELIYKLEINRCAPEWCAPHANCQNHWICSNCQLWAQIWKPLHSNEALLNGCPLQLISLQSDGYKSLNNWCTPIWQCAFLNNKTSPVNKLRDMRQASLHESKRPSSTLLTKLTSFPSKKNSSHNEQTKQWRMRPRSPFAPLFDFQKET